MREMAVTTQAEARLRTAALRLKSALAAAQVMAAGARVLALLGKANFDPNQPRVPRGSPGGGRWTRVPAWHGNNPPRGPVANEAPASRPQTETLRPIPNFTPIPAPPEIPKIEPPRASLRWPIVKLVARWVFRIGVEATPVGRVLDVIQVAEWVYDYAPYVQAYLDKPKSLAELRRAALEPKRGYDIHHIVEKTPALNDDYSLAQVNAPENLVRIPTLKHWELNAWYGRRSEDFGGVSPRAYLQGKSWEERQRVGLIGLADVGVLRP